MCDAVNINDVSVITTSHPVTINPSLSNTIEFTSTCSCGKDYCIQAEEVGNTDSIVLPHQTNPVLWHSIDAHTPPSIESAKLALADLKLLLHPKCASGQGCKVSGLTSLLKKQLMWME
ncbi:hypothetical protein PAXRUDRAFT_167223 [Paxillus rubicundulus Ve08.2h10]|uniref:Uncharacterized protein n=1 Tax=Paxillus rubicundulus Ve08.2h10 TaxID=930991 RepID=A0A0D0C2C1_9AGAM|nr:hypothetical protein PAXRUDRAFT_167223 [Paxillus rubicundulus Ve08.2h10]